MYTSRYRFCICFQIVGQCPNTQDTKTYYVGTPVENIFWKNFDAYFCLRIPPSGVSSRVRVGHLHECLLVCILVFWQVLQLRNRFANPNAHGYRDLLVTLRIDQESGGAHLCEMQIHLDHFHTLDSNSKLHQVWLKRGSIAARLPHRKLQFCEHS